MKKRLDECLKLKKNLWKGIFTPSKNYCLHNCNEIDCFFYRGKK